MSVAVLRLGIARGQHALVSTFFPQATKNLTSHSQLLRILSVIALFVGPLLAGCSTNQEPRPVHVEFEAVFQPLDTVRLDHNVFLTDISVVDISDAGEILVIDSRNARDSDLHMFEPSGSHVRKLTVIDCDPGANFWPKHAQFVGHSRIVTTAAAGPTYLFDQNGKCIAAGRTPTHMSMKGHCSLGDTIFSQQWAVLPEATIMAFSPLLAPLDSFQVQQPSFPWYHMYLSSTLGIGCFEDGPWFVFGESIDAEPLRPHEGAIRYRPSFHAAPKRDAPPNNDIEGTFAVLDEATLTSDLFELSTRTRLIVYRDGRRVGNHFDGRDRGLMIVEHGKNGYALSTVSPHLPKAAKDGVVYFRGEREQLPDGESGNWTLMRFRFLGSPSG